MLSSRALGILQILTAGILFGFLGVIGKWAYRSGLAPGELLSLRFLTAAFLLWVSLGLSRPRLLKLERKKAAAACMMGVFGYAVFSSCYFGALQGLSASLTVLLLYLYPVMVTVGARILFGEPIGRAGWIALPIVSSGLALLVWGDISVQNWGAVLLGVGSALFYSLYILCSSRVLKGVHPLSSSLYVITAAGVALALIHLRDPKNIVQIGLDGWLPPVLAIAIVGTVGPITLFLAGLQRLRNSEASILSTTEPVMGILAATLLLGERLSALQLVGGVLVLSGLVITARSAKSPESPDRQTPESAAPESESGR